MISIKLNFKHYFSAHPSKKKEVKSLINMLFFTKLNYPKFLPIYSADLMLKKLDT